MSLGQCINCGDYGECNCGRPVETDDEALSEWDSIGPEHQRRPISPARPKSRIRQNRKQEDE